MITIKHTAKPLMRCTLSIFLYETRDPLEFVDIKRGESEGSPRKKRLRLKGSLIAI